MLSTNEKQTVHKKVQDLAFSTGISLKTQEAYLIIFNDLIKSKELFIKLSSTELYKLADDYVKRNS